MYEYLVAARERVLEPIRSLYYAQYTQEFPFGHKSIRETLAHVAASEWGYNRRLKGEPIPPQSDRPFTPFFDSEFPPLDRAWSEQTEETRRTLREVGDLSRTIEFISALPGNPTIQATAGGIVAQLLFHEVHHRAQVMAMLRQLGSPVENIDYNMTFRRVLR
jgi:uncharacterized damage-inducible protein DinB